MPLFDTYVMVDWSAKSAGKTKWPKPKRDAIWWAIQRGRTDVGWKNPENAPDLSDRIEQCALFERTRDEAIVHIADFVVKEVGAKRRVLVGFDFAFGYPTGFATVVTDTKNKNPSARDVWRMLHDRIFENNGTERDRFEVAGELNKIVINSITGEDDGPFWGSPRGKSATPGENPYGEGRTTKDKERKAWPRDKFGFEVKRRTDEFAPRAKTAWQLLGQGSVGSQVLLGVPYLHRLQAQLSEGQIGSVVWPLDVFDLPPRRPEVVIAEIYPSLITTAAGKQMSDRHQVMENAMAFELLDARGDLRALFDLRSFPDEIRRRICLPAGSDENWGKMSEGQRTDHMSRVVREEGWILGAGRDDILRSVAKEDSPLYRPKVKR